MTWEICTRSLTVLLMPDGPSPMNELHAALLLTQAPIRLGRMHVSISSVFLLPLRRGLVFALALSLPVLGSAVAERFHGFSVPRAVQAAAVPLTPPRSGTAARFSSLEAGL